jgi:gamma-glutamylaminecyclotransferase
MLLFVYGTLKSSQPANHYLCGATLAFPAVTAPTYRLYDMGWHPAMVRDESNGLAVEGEIWDVPAEWIPVLDEYESVPEGFVRRPIDVPGVTGVVEAYLFAGPIPPGARSGPRWPFG